MALQQRVSPDKDIGAQQQLNPSTMPTAPHGPDQPGTML